MRYLVLGSSGQIGSALVDYLRRGGYAVSEFDIVRSASEDLRVPDGKALRQLMAASDFVFFLAFDVGGSRYLKTYEHTFEFISNNARIMISTFELLRATRVPFIFASSQMSNMNFSPYGQLKALGESFTRALGGVTVKFWNVYGVERDPEKSHVITDFIAKARGQGRIDMLTDGSEERQFLFADDCSECLAVLANAYERIDRAAQMHITSFEWVKISEIARLIAAHFPGVTVHPAKAKDDVQKGHRNEPNPYILEYWRPTTSLADGIAYIVRKTSEPLIGSDSV